MKNKQLINKLIGIVIIMICIILSITKFVDYVNQKYEEQFHYYKKVDGLTYKVTADGTLYITGNCKKQKEPDGQRKTRSIIKDYTKRVVVNLKNAQDLTNLLLFLPKVEEVDFSQTDMTKLTRTQSMFMEDEKLEYIDVSDWDVTNVECTFDMFCRCYSLKEIKGLDELSFDNCNLFDGMFNGCFLLKQIKINSKGNNVITDRNAMMWMFSGCRNLEVIDFSDFNFDIIKNSECDPKEITKEMFRDCDSLKKIIANDTFKIVEENYEGELPEIEYVNN